MHFSKYKHIIFDWNGTLLDDLWLAVEIIDGMLVKRGLESMNIKRYSEIFDFPVKDYYQNIGFDFNQESFEKVGTEFIEKYDKRQYECNLQKGCLELIEFLFQKNILLSILSAREQLMLEQNLKYYKLDKYFPKISGLNDHYANSKLENGLKLINSSTISVSETLLIGDTLHDAEVAKTMGIDCILIASGHQNVERLKKANLPIFESLTHLFPNQYTIF